MQHSFKYFHPKKDSCIYSLSLKGEEKLMETLRKFDHFSRCEVNKMPREQGFSVEKYGSELYKKMEILHPGFDRYYHFRCGDARIYGGFGHDGDDGETIYILHIDPHGNLGH